MEVSGVEMFQQYMLTEEIEQDPDGVCAPNLEPEALAAWWDGEVSLFEASVLNYL